MQSFYAERSGQHIGRDMVRRVGNVEELPFTVDIVKTQTELKEVCELRALAYGHHIGSIADSFAEPEPLDYQLGTMILIARDKESGKVVGTSRLQVNTYNPLDIESSVELPASYAQLHIAEVTRLSALPGYSVHTVRNAMWKALHRYCLATQIEGFLIGSRKALVRQYAMLGFQDVFEDRREFVHLGGLPHRVLFFDVQCAERRWHQQSHPLYHFMVKTFHPDIHIFDNMMTGCVSQLGMMETTSLTGIPSSLKDAVAMNQSAYDHQIGA